MNSSYFTLVNLDSIQSKVSRFKYSCCDIFRDYVAFGTSAGSVHLYKLPCESPPIVISVSSIINAITLLSFSPNGKWLILGDAKGLHFIEDPITSSSLFFSIDTNNAQVTSIQWLCEPPPKMNRNIPYVFAGDTSGTIWLIRHQNADVFVNLPHGINQLSIIDETRLLAATKNGPMIITHNKIENVKSAMASLSALTTGSSSSNNSSQSSNSPSENYGVRTAPFKTKSGVLSGDFGGLYANDYKAIFLARSEGRLSLASLEGKIKVTLKFQAEGLKIDPNVPLSTDLYSLMLCPPFLISAGRGKLCYVINLSSTPPKLVSAFPELSEVISFSSDGSRVLFLRQNQISLFSVCENPLVYVRYLIKQQNYQEAQDVVMEQKIADEEILNALSDKAGNPKFKEYVEKLALMNQPKPLEEVDELLYEEFKASTIPTHDMIHRLYDLRSMIVVDELIKKKIEAYVIENPLEGNKWIDEIDPDYVVPRVNDNEEAAAFVAKAAKFGTSELCKMISKLDSMPIEACVANSPPIRAHNFTGERRKQFEKMLNEVDMFESNQESDELIDSLYDHEYSKVMDRINQQSQKNHPNNGDSDIFLDDLDENDIQITPEEANYLLRVYEWESQINSCVSELKSKLELYFLSQGSKSLPNWVKTALDHEKKTTPQTINNMTFSTSGQANWGVPVHLSICPICGMQHNLGESVASVSVFPCSHICHVGCIHHRYCPICYANCMQ